MSREFRVPFVLWVCTALLAHVLWSGSVEIASRVLGQIGDIRSFAQDIRQELKGSGTFEVSLVEDPPPAEPAATVETPPEQKPPEVKPPEPEKEKEKPKPPEPKPEPEKKKDPPKKPIVLFPTPPTPPAPPPPPPPPPPPTDGRIAVKQHVKDKNQKDNPNAPFVGDEANTVKEQSVARATSHDQDDPKPTFGGQKPGPAQTPGNSDHDKVGDSDDHPGEPNKAPGEASNKDNSPLPAAPPAPHSTVVPTAAPRPPAPPAAGNGIRPQPAAQPQPTPPVTNPNPDKGPVGPDVVAADKGGYSLNPRRKPGGPQASSSAAMAKAPTVPTIPGLGLGKGPNERGVQLNLNQRDVVASVGADTLRRERAADGERRRSAHRGSWQSSTFERWRPAIENYVSSVRPGNQTALNTARVPFGTYLVSIHNKIHPIFADGFLDSLDGLPSGHPLNDQKMFTSLEIVVDREQGRIVKMGVVKTSGQTAFDMAALDSVYRSQPFGKPPEAILSADGNVYLHWEFHRNPIFACSTMNARPYMLNRPPSLQQPGQPAPTPGQPSDPKEKGAPPAPAPGSDHSRYGLRLLPPPGSQG